MDTTTMSFSRCEEVSRCHESKQERVDSSHVSDVVRAFARPGVRVCGFFEFFASLQSGYILPGDNFISYFELEKGVLPGGVLVPRKYTWSFQPDPKKKPDEYALENKTYTHIEYGTPSADKFAVPDSCKSIPDCQISAGISATDELKRLMASHVDGRMN